MIKYQGIYKIRNLLNGKVYIGQSSDITKRFKDHKNNINFKKRHPLYNSIRKYGIENFEFIVIEHINDINKLNEAEQFWMDYYNSYNPEYGYNLRPKAESNRGMKQTPEHIKKKALANTGKKRSKETCELLSRVHKGQISWCKGKKMSEETKLKISLTKKGKPSWNKGLKMSEEFCELLSRLRKGRRSPRKGCNLSETTKLKISFAKKGKVSPMKGRLHTKDSKEKMSVVRKNRILQGLILRDVKGRFCN